MLPVGTMLTAVGELSTAVEHPTLFPVSLAGGRAAHVQQLSPLSPPLLLLLLPSPQCIPTPCCCRRSGLRRARCAGAAACWCCARRATAPSSCPASRCQS